MNSKYIIKLDISDVMEFNRVANSITKPVVLRQENAKVNGKSLLGIYTFDLSKPISITIEGKNEDEIVNKKFYKWLLAE